MNTWIKAGILLAVAAAVAVCGALSSIDKTDIGSTSSGNSDADYVGDDQMMVSATGTIIFDAVVKAVDGNGLVTLASTTDENMSSDLVGEFSLSYANKFKCSDGIKAGDTVEITIPCCYCVAETYPPILESVLSVELPDDNS